MTTRPLVSADSQFAEYHDAWMTFAQGFERRPGDPALAELLAPRIVQAEFSRVYADGLSALHKIRYLHPGYFQTSSYAATRANELCGLALHLDALEYRLHLYGKVCEGGVRNSASTYFTPFGVYRRSLEEARSEINSAYTALESFVGQTMERHYQGTAQTMVGGAAGVVSPAPAARISLGQLMMIAAGVILVAGIVSACIIIYNNCESATDTGGGGGSGHD